MRKSFIKLLSAASLVLCPAAHSFAAGDLIPDQNQKGKWGYIDEAGTCVIDYKYDAAENFKDGRAKVRKGDNYGYIDTRGEKIIDTKYNTIEYHSPAAYKVSAGGKYKDGVLLDEKYGFIATDGTVLLKPEYEEVGQFKDGLAYVRKGDKYGYIDSSFNFVIQCKYKAVGAFNKDGYVWVNDGGKFEKGSPNEVVDGKFGIFDKTGKVIVPANHKMAGVFVAYKQSFDENRLKQMETVERTVFTESGSHHLYVKRAIDGKKFSVLPDSVPGFWSSKKIDGSKNAVYDIDGNVIIKEGKYRQAFFPEEGLAMVRPKNASEANFVDITTGKLLFKKSVANAWAFYDGVAIVTNGRTWHFINKQGEPVSKDYEKIYPRKDGVYIVKSAEGYGLLDKSANVILEANNYAIYPSSHGLLYRKDTQNSLAGYMNNGAEWVISPQFSNGYSFKYGSAFVKAENGWGLIDTDGNELVKCRWWSLVFLTQEGQKIVWAQKAKGDTYYAVDITTDQELFSGQYAWLRNFGQDYENVAIVGTDKKHCGVVDAAGKMIIPMEFSYTAAFEGYADYIAKNKTEWTATDTYKLKLYHNNERNRGGLYEVLDASLWDY